MKVIVLQKFKDKYSGIWHKQNDELNITSERYEEIKKFVKIVDTDNKKKKKKTEANL